MQHFCVDVKDEDSSYLQELHWDARSGSSQMGLWKPLQKACLQQTCGCRLQTCSCQGSMAMHSSVQQQCLQRRAAYHSQASSCCLNLRGITHLSCLHCVPLALPDGAERHGGGYSATSRNFDSAVPAQIPTTGVVFWTSFVQQGDASELCLNSCEWCMVHRYSSQLTHTVS